MAQLHDRNSPSEALNAAAAHPIRLLTTIQNVVAKAAPKQIIAELAAEEIFAAPAIQGVITKLSGHGDVKPDANEIIAQQITGQGNAALAEIKYPRANCLTRHIAAG